MGPQGNLLIHKVKSREELLEWLKRNIRLP